MTIPLNQAAEFYRALGEHPAADAVILDFDETLWLRNSTEEFLASVRPRWLAAMVLQVLGFIKPWRLLRSGEHYRDWMRVVAVLIVAPWSLWRWRREAARLGPRYLNRSLLEAVRRQHRKSVGVITFGFREIVRPLMDAIDRDLPLTESCSLRHGARLRIRGKAAGLREDIGAERLRRALVVTDSAVDRDLLEASDKGFLVQWPDAHYKQAGLRPLMPFVYLQKVKRPDENYLRNAILGHDLPVLLLSYAVISSKPLVAAGAVLLYVLSFFTAYETGYYENDRLGLLLESKPKVSPNYHSLGRYFSPRFAWSAAIVLAGLSSLLAFESHSWIPDAIGDQGVIGFLAVWAVFVLFLVVMRLLFRWQNVIHPQGRIVPMLGLQVGRVLGYAAILPTTVIGALFCVAHGVSRWIPYLVYRFGGSRKEVPNHVNCFMLLVLFAGAAAIGGDWRDLLTWQSGLIFAYTGARAAKEMLGFGSRLLPLKVRPPESVSEPGRTATSAPADNVDA
ncbi:haloacid dehalogenase-like hydrolase [Sphingomonas sp. BN140010]|uniref:Haloacid dehalogenase-like hydrolase n=1 Tax=Sphingomonas arvum TaxID=2992113 RepID=A0ABT3JCP7_9SPHN|nr:HAD family hydrolase [Sphingomonas sp. BN140010]MCW3796571.1 haloacid dehalogenase-like hydrolase [Sphingomonas sp. BN140010]